MKFYLYHPLLVEEINDKSASWKVLVFPAYSIDHFEKQTMFFLQYIDKFVTHWNSSDINLFNSKIWIPVTEYQQHLIFYEGFYLHHVCALSEYDSMVCTSLSILRILYYDLSCMYIYIMHSKFCGYVLRIILLMHQELSRLDTLKSQIFFIPIILWGTMIFATW